MISLKEYNSFGVDHSCTQLISIKEVKDAIKYFQKPALILGGGSNVLFRQDYDGHILLNRIHGREIIFKNEDEVHVRLGGGENWHHTVLWCLDNGYGGVENLSLIPGSVGAAPIQNIGAYGVELKDVFIRLEGVHLGENRVSDFNYKQCHFSYRNSIFKNELKDKYFITHIVLKLTNKNHRKNIDYGIIKDYINENNLSVNNINDISKAIIAIRDQKLPNPCLLGNSGSFFKNPIISMDTYKDLKKILPNISSFPYSKDKVKISAAYIIEQAGWKGKRIGNAGVYERHALVLVNYGDASGTDIWNLAVHIMKDVYNTYSIKLMPEVNVLPPQE